MRLSWIIRVGPKTNDKCPYKGPHKGKQEKAMWQWKQGRVGYAATNQEMPGATQSWERLGRTGRTVPGALREAWSPTPWLRLVLPTVKENFSVVLSHQVCVHLLSKPKETSRDGEKNSCSGGKVYQGGPRQEEDTPQRERQAGGGRTMGKCQLLH